MRILHFIIVGAIMVAFVIGCMKARRKIIGGVIGGFLGLVILFLFAAIYVWRGGDPTAAGVFSFFGLFTIPLGIGIGVAVANQMPKGRGPLGKDKVGNDD